jgi:hypothetical protein
MALQRVVQTLALVWQQTESALSGRFGEPPHGGEYIAAPISALNATD